MKITIFGGPIHQSIDPVMMLVPTGKGHLAQEIAREMRQHVDEVELIGNFDGKFTHDFHAIEQAIESLDSHIVIFMPHLPNFFAHQHLDHSTSPGQKIRVNDDGVATLDLHRAPKLLPLVKKLHPEVLLVPFKIADPDMSMVDILRWMLNAHAALAVYSRLGNSQHFWILDVLGNEIACTRANLPQVLATEILHFTRAIRRRSKHVSDSIPSVPHVKDFLDFSHAMQPAFSQIIQKNVGSGRWPGNFSFRCTYGFLSARFDQGFVITKRNVAKSGLTQKDFVYVDGTLHNEALHYAGSADAKPSVDAPVHRVIYAELPWVQAIVHGHLFCEGSYVYPEKLTRWPCGAENEAYEVIAKAPKEMHDLWVANIDGHGFIALIGSDQITTGLKKLRLSQYAINH
ncbi:MAG: class II aldolase/adducin family protein [Parcubacteria group bacterium]|jgi:hypothetical protein